MSYGKFVPVIDIMMRHDNTLRHALTCHAIMVRSIVRALEEGLQGLNLDIAVMPKDEHEVALTISRGHGKDLDLLCQHTINLWSPLAETQHIEIILTCLIAKFSDRIAQFKDETHL